MKGRISNISSFSAVDGPGIRYTVFFQGCPLICPYCHNPEARAPEGGYEMDVEAIMKKIRNGKEYFGKKGGVTISGGEPLLQEDFLYELLLACKNEGIHTALDTSGAVITPKTKKILELCDLVLLDVKMTDTKKYEKHIGMSLSKVLLFLSIVQEADIPVWVRYTAVPGLNDSEEEVRKLKLILEDFPCVKKIEVLAFHNLCIEKYDEMGEEFLLRNTPPMREEQRLRLQDIADKKD